MRHSTRLKVLVVTTNVVIVIVLAWVWTNLTQESQLLAGVLVSGNIIGSVELYSFFIERHEKQLVTPDLNASIKTAKRQVYHKASWVKNAHTLVLDVGNKGRDTARYCKANLTVQGVTEELELIPWRLLEVAGVAGSSWRKSDTVDILRGFSASLWVCYSFDGAAEAYIETGRPEIQESSPYGLRFGQDYEVEVCVLGEGVDLKVWTFKFRCDAWDTFVYTQPEETLKEET